MAPDSAATAARRSRLRAASSADLLLEADHVGVNAHSLDPVRFDVENVGFSDAQVLDNRRQLGASLKLVHWLRCRFHIQIRNVIGHNESLSSPYHHEDVPYLRTQTHADFNHHDMNIYRAKLRALGGC